ncbi:excinuclease ABC subunit UvrA [Evansella halocellulosilytica]|uniref:excinuclease ABC subunit UvrA n=1 Tax=Evansella halocellulosilytica TaxID=2011013 RepID=UPI000BB6BD49|nr:excinuclease ABC subunit UvrA [Evansella halocellulosilytica]
MKNVITIKGAKENNLKNISLDIPKNQLVVITGPSGSGKSTLALDILQRECQRQYMESSGMLTDSVNKPKVDSIVGLSPAISIGQHITNRNPRSTVGTITDMYTYLRLIFEKIGERPCPHCGEVITANSNDEQVSAIMHCPKCQQEVEPLTRRHFSFNTMEGACQVCGGLGKETGLNESDVFDENKSIQEGAVTFWHDFYTEYNGPILEAAASHYGFEFDLAIPLKEFTDVQKDLLYYGVESEEFRAHFPQVKPPKSVGKGKFEGVIPGMWRRYKEKEGNSGEAEYFYQQQCRECNGDRLKKASREVTVGGASIVEISRSSLKDARNWLNQLTQQINSQNAEIAETFIHDLTIKVKRIIHVGLGYLSLDRQAISLSGGEAQRLRLASILGSGLTGVLYILDEPTSGLHPRDTQGLINVMKQLRDLGNTVLLIEHDVAVMKEADYIIDMGPEAGEQGGRVVGEGPLLSLKEQNESITGRYLLQSSLPKYQPRYGSGEYITVHGATKHNLKNLTVSFPLKCFVSVTGVSGSGKSTLLFDLLASQKKKGVFIEGCKNITGLENVEDIVEVTQSPLSRMQRSNIATYTDVFSQLRTLFASLPEAKARKLQAKHFSFNTKGGRCEHCQGLGEVLMDMQFLPDMKIQCPVCHGQRFKEGVLEVRYEGFTITELLNVSISQSSAIFQNNQKITSMIKLLSEVGLGYLKWGQAVTTLSGGEGQRLKLAKDLSKKTKGKTLYLLDEPTTGLHPTDVKKLMFLLQKLVDAGNSVIVVEHNTEVIAASDWVIDIGPEGGESGGRLVAEGTPDEIASTEASYTGSFLENLSSY